MYTNDQKLLLLLTRMSDLIIHTANEPDTFGQLNWMGSPDEVGVTELLCICRFSRRDYTQAEKVKYLNTLRAQLETKLGRQVSDYDLLDADWADQVEAMAKVKGIE